MADTKITALAAITTVDPAADVLPIVDISDTSMAASGTTKKITSNQILGAGGTATLASATITGDLTVDTSTLKVDSANNRVGIGTATPGNTLHVIGGNAGQLLLDNGNQQYTQLLFQRNSALNTGGDILIDGTGSTFNFRTLAVNMPFVWHLSASAGSPTTAMTLNSTGLGVGGSPAFKLDVAGAANSAPITLLRLNNTGTTGGGPGIAARLQFNAGATALGFVQGCNFASGSIGVQISGDGTNIHQTIDSSGNVGIGVTPKSWASGYRALQIGIYSALTDAQGGATYLTNNAYFDSVDSRWEYITNNRVVRYDQDTADGGHKWYSAGSGAVNAAITWGNPLMTLDASGNLILLSPSTPPTLTTNGQLTVNATSNTNLRFSYRGSDGVTRVANLTLA